MALNKLEELKEDVELLLEERDKLNQEIAVTEELNDVCRELANMLYSPDGSSNRNVSGVDLSPEIDATESEAELSSGSDVTTNFKAQYTVFPTKSMDSHAQCPGCGQQFKAQLSGHQLKKEPAYYEHCIKQCSEYKKLGRIVHCFECKLSFFNLMARSTHTKTCSRKLIRPDWMPNELFTRSIFKEAKTTIDCLGCQKTFNARKIKSTTYGELAYYVHCIDECEEYKKLKMIRECKPCAKKFLNARTYNNHLGKVHQTNTILKSDTAWVGGWYVKTVAGTSEDTSTISCKGCGEQFKAQPKNREKRQIPELAYHVHCLKDCNEYKKLGLIRECHQCEKMFLNSTAYNNHQGRVHKK